MRDTKHAKQAHQSQRLLLTSQKPYYGQNHQFLEQNSLMALQLISACAKSHNVFHISITKVKYIKGYGKLVIRPSSVASGHRQTVIVFYR